MDLITALKVFDALLCSYEYNRSEEYLIQVYIACKGRAIRVWHEQNLNEIQIDDVDIIHGTAICYFGEYGISPRYGWIDDNLIVIELCKIYDEHIKELRQLMEEEIRKNGG